MEVSSDFKWKLVTIEDYNDILTDWWKEWDFPVPHPSLLSDVGIIIYKDETPLYAGFLYYTNSAWGWIEYVVSNKKAPIKLKKGALQALIDVLSSIAKNHGVKMLFTSTVLETFKNSLMKTGFEIGDTNNYQLVKKI